MVAVITVDHMRAILEEITYRPGWTMAIKEDQHEGPYLRVIAPTKNSYDESADLDLGINSYLSPNDRADERAFVNFLIWRLERIESHEAREWLKRNGKAIFDPHEV